MRVVFFFLVTALFQVNGSVSDDGFEETQFGTTVSNAVSKLITDFYMHKSTTLSITSSVFHLENFENQMSVINEILYRTRSKIVVVIEDFSFMSTTIDRFYNIMFIDSYEAFLEIFKLMRDDSLFNYTGFYTIVLTKLWRDQYIIISKILNDCWSVYITNVIIVVSMGTQFDSQSAIYTYFPYTLYHCERATPVILNYFSNDSFMYDTEHFPDKLKNMYKCPLTLVTYNVTPYMILYRDRHDQSYRTEGIDGSTFRALSQHLNFTPTIDVPNNVTDTPYFMEMVMTGRANLTIGGFSFSIQRAKNMSASSPYLYSSILFAVPKGKPYTALQKLFLPFNVQIWIVIAMLLLCSLIATTFLSETKLRFLAGESSSPLLNTISVLFGGVVTVEPKRNFARTVLIIWIIGCVVVRSAFQGSLFEYIQKPRNSPGASTLPELFARNYTLYMSPEFYELLKRSKKNVRIHNFGSDEKYEVLKNYNFHGAVMTSDVGISYHNLRHFKTTGVVSSTKERVFLLPLCIFFRKHSCLNKPITRLINQYTSNGLLQHWTSKYFQKRFVTIKTDDFEDHHPQRLTVIQLLGGFIIGLILLAVAFVVFILEILSKNCEFLNKLLRS